MGGRIALHAAFTLETAAPGPRRRQPRLADDDERAARKRADDALADRIEQIGIEAFATEWAAQPLFDGQPSASRRRVRGPPAQHAARPRRGAARPRAPA
jgi:hypothetical protein